MEASAAAEKGRRSEALSREAEAAWDAVHARAELYAAVCGRVARAREALRREADLQRDRDAAAAAAVAAANLRLATLADLRLRLRAADAIITDSAAAATSAAAAQRLSLAVLAAAAALDPEDPHVEHDTHAHAHAHARTAAARAAAAAAQEALAALHILADAGDAVVAAALRSLAPVGTEATPPPPPPPRAGELAWRFEGVCREARKAALAPEGAGYLSQLTASARLGWRELVAPDAPATAAAAAVAGAGDRAAEQEAVVEARLLRARRHARLGELALALAEVEGLPGPAGQVTTAWAADVRRRLQLEQALALLRAHATVMTIACV